MEEVYDNQSSYNIVQVVLDITYEVSYIVI